MSTTETYAKDIFERAKAKVLYEAGRFLQNRDRILDMIDVSDLMRRKAESTGDTDLATISEKLRSKLDGLYASQLSLEDKVRAAMSGLQAQAGAGPLALVQTALGIAPLLKDLARQVATVKIAQKATDALKSRTLTSADLASLQKTAPAAVLGTAAAVGLGIMGLWFLSRGRRGR